MLCVTRSKSQKSKFFDAARLAAKWDSMVAHNINKIMTKKSEAFSAERNMCNVHFRCFSKFRDVCADVVLILVLFRVVLFHFHSLSFLF